MCILALADDMTGALEVGAKFSGAGVRALGFARDALNPIRTSSVLAMLDPELPCTVFDGETDADLGKAASSILADNSMRIAAGPAGLAEVIASRIDLPREAPPALPGVGSCLVM